MCALYIIYNIIVNVNNVKSQYYIGTFNGNEFPLSIGTCNPLDIFGQGGYQIAECVGESTLRWNYYSDADCSTFVFSVEYNSTWQTRNGTLNDFNCDDSGNTAYAKMEFEAFGCDAYMKATMHAAIGVCTFLYDDEVSLQVYCEPEFAELYFFDSEGETFADCEYQDLYNVANMTNECDFVIKTAGTKIFGKVCGYISTSNTALLFSFFIIGL